MRFRPLLRSYRLLAFLTSTFLVAHLISPGVTLAREIPGAFLADTPNPAPSEVQMPAPVVAAATATPAPSEVQIPAPVVAAATAIARSATADLQGDGQLAQAIDRAYAGLNGIWGIGVANLNTGETLLINAGRPYPAASQYKLLVFYSAYQNIAAGKLQLDQVTRMLDTDYVDSLLWDEELKPGDRVTVKGLMRVLVIQSSNAASHALARLIGGTSIPALINGAAQEIGLSQTNMDDEDGPVTSVRDLMRYYSLLYSGKAISMETSQSMLGLLKEQQINDRIPALLPPGVKVAHKTGNLPGVVNDGGIIFGPRSDVLLIVLTDEADHDQATAAIANIGQIVYDWYNR